MMNSKYLWHQNWFICSWIVILTNNKSYSNVVKPLQVSDFHKLIPTATKTNFVKSKPKIRYYRSSNQRCSVRKGALRNFTKFTGKHLCQNLFFNKNAGLRPATLLKKRIWHRYFTCEFCEISENTFFTEHLRETAPDTTKIMNTLWTMLTRLTKVWAMA